MAFVKLNKLKTAGKNAAAKAGWHPLLKVDGVNEHIKQTYLQGVVLGSLLDDGELTDNERSYIENLGSSLSIDKQDVTACVDTVTQLETDEDKEEFINEMLTLLQPQEIAFLFIADFEGIIDLNEKLNDELVEYLNYFGNGLFHREDWRDFVWDHEKLIDAKRVFDRNVKAADAGDAFAQAVVGQGYFNGLGVGKDLVLAAKFYKQSADAGNPLGGNWYARCLFNGEGVPRDVSAAASYYEKGVSHGMVSSIINLAAMYRDGNGVLKDNKRAYELFVMAAGKGGEEIKKEVSFANIEAGFLLRSGVGCICDLQAAASRFRNAAELDDPRGMYWLGLCYSKGEGIEKDVKKAFFWHMKAATCGNMRAQEEVGLAYRNGCGVDRDDVAAFEWFRKAAEQGLANSQNWVGWMYDTGTGTEKDDVKAFVWYSRAAEQGLAIAESNCAVFLSNGRGTQCDLKRAAEMYLRSAEHGYVPAMLSISKCYHNGTGVAQDHSKWVFWLTKAAEGGNMDAQYELGSLYYITDKQSGIRCDRTCARGWLEKAAAQGHQEAQKKIKMLDLSLFCFPWDQGK